MCRPAGALESCKSRIAYLKGFLLCTIANIEITRAPAGRHVSSSDDILQYQFQYEPQRGGTLNIREAKTGVDFAIRNLICKL